MEPTPSIQTAPEDVAKTPPEIRIDAQLSLPVLVSWLFGIILAVAGVATVFAEQQHRIDYTEKRQTRVETSISNIENMVSRQNDLLIKLSTKIEGMEKK